MVRETKTKWHRWPEERPQIKQAYLLTLLIDGKYLGMKIAMFRDDSDVLNPPWGMIETAEMHIIAWADLPLPYDPGNPRVPLVDPYGP